MEGAANESTDESEENKGSNNRNDTLFLCRFNSLKQFTCDLCRERSAFFLAQCNEK